MSDRLPSETLSAGSDPDVAGVVDLRSDSVTVPTEAMWTAMRHAKLGWASAGEDPTLAKLEEYAAVLSGKQASLLVATGAMANLAALMTHTNRGEQILLGQSSHILWCEEWSLTYICGLLPKALAVERGQIPPETLETAVSESIYRHRPKTSLLCLENTDNVYGAAASPRAIGDVSETARDLGLAIHLDGARVFNACVALGVTLESMLAGVDSAMIGLNKGLCAPSGALLVGSAAFIDECQINLRRLGGGSFHQAGIAAAGALVALNTMVERLEDDHRRAKQLAYELASLETYGFHTHAAETNIVVVDIEADFISAEQFVLRLEECGVRAYVSSAQSIRFVTHRHVDDDAIRRAVSSIREVVAAASRLPAHSLNRVPLSRGAIDV